MQFYTLSLAALCISIVLFIAAYATATPSQNVIILLGPPASGKGTQAAELSKILNLPHISTGDLLRANISKSTKLGGEAKDYMDKGQLVPDTLVLSMLFERIAEQDAREGYILDGFPRTIPQARALEDHLPQTAKITVLNLDVSDATIIKRALGRKRSDDTPEVIQERLNAYNAQTAPLIDFYTKKGLLQQINGENSPEEVQKELLEKLKRQLQNSSEAKNR